MKNNGEKIKTIATILFVFGFILSIGYGIYLIILDLHITGIITIILGSLSVLLYTFLLKCFGDLIIEVDKTHLDVRSVIKILDPNSTNKENFIVEDNNVYININENKTENIPVELTIEERAEKEIKHLNDYEKKYLKEKYPKWYNSIKQLSKEDLCKNIEDESKNQMFIYLCCIELLERKK